ncbi:MAG: hypothetical protein IKJ77_03170 [Firmicutes bacterium]|nr:hypothetical protein [Bacillota bacterium]
MSTRGWVCAGLVFWTLAFSHALLMAAIIFGLQTTGLTVLLIGCPTKAVAAALLAFGCAMIGILGKLLGGVEGLVEAE